MYLRAYFFNSFTRKNIISPFFIFDRVNLIIFNLKKRTGHEIKKNSYPDVFRDSPDPRALKNLPKYLLSSDI